MGFVRAFIEDEDGTTSIEYGLLALLLGVAIIPALGIIAPKLNDHFSSVGDGL